MVNATEQGKTMENTRLALLGFILLSTPLAATAQQHNYDNFDYTSDGSAITITGYTGQGGAVTIPDYLPNDPNDPDWYFLPVTRIGDRAFQGWSSLTSVTIPSSVTSIGDYAFASCTELINVTIPFNVRSIRLGAFYYCTSLTNVTIPASVSSIGNYAFQNCTSLIGITVDAANSAYSS